MTDGLNHLIEINKDAEAGFRTAAANVNNTELESLFNKYAGQHAKLASELQRDVKRAGEIPADSGTAGGAVHRGWMDVKSALSGGSAASMLSSCRSGEDSAIAAYADVMKDTPSGQAYSLLEKHQQQIREIYTRLTRLLGEIKDGVEFQENKEE